MAIEIAVIIPCNHTHHDLAKIVRAVCNQSFKPTEIVIVDSSLERGMCPAEISTLCEINGIDLKYVHRSRAFPGQARNIGISKSHVQFIAFIDVQTIPRFNWLESSLKTLANDGIGGVWGSTFFQAHNTFERLVRDGFYGTKLRKTLPGSIFRREVFGQVGQFINWVRAGEDTEWMLRMELMKLPIIYPDRGMIDYIGLIGMDSIKLLKKWYRNYSASRYLPHFFPQRLLLWMVLYPLFILIAFNWNYLIANWSEESPFYIGHVTKIVAIIPILAYVLVRGLVLPLHRGVDIWSLLPFRFILIIIICVIADAVKILLFSFPRCKEDVNTKFRSS